MIITSIDIGHSNLGLVQAFIDDEWSVTIRYAKKINLKHISHVKVGARECCIPHTFETVDLVAHFIQEYGSFMDEADAVIIERQPPTGLTAIEALLFSEYRKKATLISPNSLHKHFCIGSLDYEQRKVQTERIAEDYLRDFNLPLRKHDIADAVCMILFYVHKPKEKQRWDQIDRTLPFENFRLC